eukprot:1156703-Pelagomonas_calceolata.AAC.7
MGAASASFGQPGTISGIALGTKSRVEAFAGRARRGEEEHREREGWTATHPSDVKHTQAGNSLRPMSEALPDRNPLWAHGKYAH